MTHTSRNKALDVLRFFAVFFILLHHQHIIHFPVFKSLWLGVDLFFVISGYLVSGLVISEIDKNGKFSFRRFFIRRGFKIYPSYYIFLALQFIATDGFGLTDYEKPWSRLLKLVFLQNYFPEHNLDFASHTWTIAIEEHFYLLLGLLFPLFYKKTGSKAVWWILGGILFITAFRSVSALMQDSGYQPYYMFSHFRMDSLMLGVVVQLVTRSYPAEKLSAFISKFSFPLISLAFIGLFISLRQQFALGSSLFPVTIGFLIIGISFAILLVVSLYSFSFYKLDRLGILKIGTSILAYIGKNSYGIYLFHVLVFRTVLYLPGYSYLPPYAAFVFQIGAAIAAGVLSAYVIEKPFLKLRDKLYPSKGGTIVAGVRS